MHPYPDAERWRDARIPRHVPDTAASQADVSDFTFVVTFDVLAKKGRFFSVLLHLARNEPINMSQFTRASHLVPDRAKVLRQELESYGLIDVKVVRVQGPAEILEIQLTPLGREVASHLIAIDDVLARPDERGGKGRRRGRPD